MTVSGAEMSDNIGVQAKKPATSSRRQVKAAKAADAKTAVKTAVIMIHGMGEQWPMETLRGFVDAAWKHDAEMSEPWSEGATYSKPERITGNFELRRITTRYWRSEEGAEQPSRRMDFFEFYWAHLMKGSTLGAVVSWLLRLLIRRPSRVPRRLFWGWLAGLLILGASAVLAILTALRPDLTQFGVPTWTWGLLAASGATISALWLRPVAGDAARYLSPSPSNVEVRQEIREAGIDLLMKIQATGEYDRIIIAGHSLGSVIGYDVLNYAWGRLDTDALKAAHGAGSATMRLLDELESAAGNLENSDGTADPSRYRDLQRAYFRSLSAARNTDGTPLWLVSDFVTMGSPLSSADVLLAKDRRTLEERIAYREAAVSPPSSERKTEVSFSYPSGGKARTPHHGAVFAPTVWTNIFHPNIAGLIGDFVSGPVAPLLGRGIRDVRVPIGFPAFRHLSYWSRPMANGPAIRALRRALNLRLWNEDTLWRSLKASNPVPAARLAASAGQKALP